MSYERFIVYENKIVNVSNIEMVYLEYDSIKIQPCENSEMITIKAGKGKRLRCVWLYFKHFIGNLDKVFEDFGTSFDFDKIIEKSKQFEEDEE